MPKEPEETEQLLNAIEALRQRVTSLEKKKVDGTREDSEINEPFRSSDIPADTPERTSARLTPSENDQTSRALLNATADSVLLIDKNGLILDANNNLATSLGKPRESIIGTIIYDHLSPAIAAWRKEKELEAAQKKKLIRFEDLRDGRWRENSVYPVFGAQGELIQFAIFSHDITEHRKVEESLSNALDEVRRMKEKTEAENIYLYKEIQMAHLHGDIVGQSESIKSVLSLAEQVAETDSTVLILGETGTGKELLARAIHNMSPRRDRPLVTVNCAAIPGTLVESELFGREKGAFTGAVSRQIGRFEIANKSTIFLDEIGELSQDIQAKLLRVLQEGQIERLGSAQTINVDVRIIAATNRDLEQEISANKFREDLFYRLNVFPISIPPLRDRKEDIPTLVWSFIDQMCEKMGKRIEKIPQQSIDALQNHDWPGNIRELHNVIERAMIHANNNILRIPSLSRTTSVTSKTRTISEIERNHILEVLKQTGWRIRGRDGAAEILGIKPTTLESRMLKLNIKRPLKIHDNS